MPRILLRQLTKCFGSGPRAKPALQGLELEVRDHEFLAVVGPSGAGKTTLLRLIAGLERPDAGQIYFGQQLVNGLDPAKRRVGMVFQAPSLYPHLDVGQNLGFALRLRHRPRKEIRRQVAEIAGFLGLADLLGRRPESLSGGERQRVALGRALVLHPEIFLLDEPLANLDPVWHDQLRAEIRRVHERFPATTIYVTHDQSEAMRMGGRIAVLESGSLHQTGQPLELYTHPADLFVAQFFGRPPMNLVRGRLIERAGQVLFSFGGFELPAPPALREHLGRELVAGWRPEWLELSRSPTQTSARVEQIERLGAENIWRLEVGGLRFTLRTGPEQFSQPGSSIWIDLKTERAGWFDGETGKRIG